MKTAARALLLLFLGATIAPADTTETLGDIGEIAVPASGLLVAALHKDGRGALQAAEAFAVTLVVVHGLKRTVNRTRPDGGRHSFPSGHAAGAFAGAGFLHRRYGWSYGVPAYAAAAFVGHSRVHARRHWTSDVVAGAAIGIGSSLVFTRRYQKIILHPTFEDGGGGIAIAVAW